MRTVAFGNGDSHAWLMMLSSRTLSTLRAWRIDPFCSSLISHASLKSRAPRILAFAILRFRMLAFFRGSIHSISLSHGSAGIKTCRFSFLFPLLGASYLMKT